MNVERAPCSDSYAVTTSQVGLGLLGGCAKVFKEQVGGPETERAALPKFRGRIEPCVLHPASTSWCARPETAQRHRCGRRSGPSCKRLLAGKPRSRRPTVPHDFLIA